MDKKVYQMYNLKWCASQWYARNTCVRVFDRVINLKIKYLEHPSNNALSFPFLISFNFIKPTS